MLRSLVNLRVLELDLPTRLTFDKDEDESEQIDTMEGTLFRSIETCASQRLEVLKLIFQTSIRLPVLALCSMLDKHPGLRTIKLEDVDIEDVSISQKVLGHKKQNGKMLRKKIQVVQIGSDSTGLTTPSRPSSPIAISPEDESPALLSPRNQLVGTNPFGLRFLSINSTHTSDSVFEYILERCSRIQAIHLHSCDMITDTTLENIVKYLPKPSSISLSSCKKLTPEGLNSFFQNISTSLVHVHICDMMSLKNEGIRILSQRHSQSLRKLAIYFSPYVTDVGIKDLLATCKELRVLGIHASGATTSIFDQPWACHGTLEQLDLQGAFKSSAPEAHPDDINVRRYSVTMAWRDRQAKIDAFQVTKSRLKTLSRLKNLRLSAGEIGKEVLEGFGPEQKIEVLHLYGLSSSQADSLPWKSIRTNYPYLKQLYCGVIGVLKKDIKDELFRLNIELLSTSSIPDLAFENSFDDFIYLNRMK
ncbi:hypothetical protein BGZ76_000623 [Entomortierella beljakovae]|nr:hypothetical protein BGZ76_000623 [Entomortierella beljakovae]